MLVLSMTTTCMHYYYYIHLVHRQLRHPHVHREVLKPDEVFPGVVAVAQPLGPQARPAEEFGGRVTVADLAASVIGMDKKGAHTTLVRT